MEETQNFEEEEELLGHVHTSKTTDTLTKYYFTFFWRFGIPLDGKSHEFTSPVIRTKHEDNFNFAWRLSYSKSGSDNYHNNFVISLLSFDKRNLEVCVECYIEDGPYSKFLTQEGSFDLSSETPIQKECTFWDGDLQRIYQEKIVSLLRNNQPHRLGELHGLPLCIKVKFEFSEMEYHVCASLKVADDLETLLQHNDELADVTFEIGGKEFKAHKCILAARSPVFAKMFEAQEKDNNRYSIEDIHPEVFQHLLIFVYCGKTDDARNCNKLPELRLAAEKFGLRV